MSTLLIMLFYTNVPIPRPLFLIAAGQLLQQLSCISIPGVILRNRLQHPDGFEGVTMLRQVKSQGGVNGTLLIC